MRLIVLLSLLALLLVGCASPTPPPIPTVTATLLPVVDATATAPLASEQPCIPTSDALSRYEALGLCLLTPREATAQETMPGTMLVISQPFQADQPEARVTLLIERQPANGRTLDTIIGEVWSQYPDLAPVLGQSQATLGGQPAMVIDGLPGQVMNRQAFVVVGDSLYTLLLMPYGSSVPEAQPIADALWQTTAASLTFTARP